MGERLLEPFETYGWTPDAKLSDDDNMLDLLLIVTRCSKLKQGSMACIITRPAKDSEDETLLSRIQSVANNQEMYKPKSSDIHAEVAALGYAARYGRPTDQCTAYITMPPCRKCFSALYCAGINRVVSVHQPSTQFASFGIELVGATNIQENRARVQVFFDKNIDGKTKHECGKKREREE